MVANGRNYVLDQWWYCAFPGAADLPAYRQSGLISLVMAIRDLLDPKGGGKAVMTQPVLDIQQLHLSCPVFR